MTGRVCGSFDVKLTPQPPTENLGDSSIARLAIDKQFHGELDAESKGEMLAHRTSTPGSAAYVAIERVTGCFRGRTGSFVLQHRGVMNRGTSELLVTVVPDSATDELAGLAGTMMIHVEGGKHSYEFDYTLPDAV